MFERLNPKQFHDAFLAWINALAGATQGKLIAIDGKSLRHSFEKASKQNPLHLVSAWSCENQVVLGQQAVADKSNEIEAIDRLLKLIDLKGAVVTIDAIGCQKKFADAIVDAKGDYVLALKGNQPCLHEAVVLAFAGATPELLDKRLAPCVETADKGHGRLEIRKYWTGTIDIAGLADVASEWKGLVAIGIAENVTETSGKVSSERRYFLLSFSGDVEPPQANQESTLQYSVPPQVVRLGP